MHTTWISIFGYLWKIPAVQVSHILAKCCIWGTTFFVRIISPTVFTLGPFFFRRSFEHILEMCYTWILIFDHLWKNSSCNVEVHHFFFLPKIAYRVHVSFARIAPPTVFKMGTNFFRKSICTHNGDVHTSWILIFHHLWKKFQLLNIWNGLI